MTLPTPVHTHSVAHLVLNAQIWSLAVLPINLRRILRYVIVSDEIRLVKGPSLRPNPDLSRTSSSCRVNPNLSSSSVMFSDSNPSSSSVCKFRSYCTALQNLGVLDSVFTVLEDGYLSPWADPVPDQSHDKVMLSLQNRFTDFNSQPKYVRSLFNSFFL